MLPSTVPADYVARTIPAAHVAAGDYVVTRSGTGARAARVIGADHVPAGIGDPAAPVTTGAVVLTFADPGIPAVRLDRADTVEVLTNLYVWHLRRRADLAPSFALPHAASDPASIPAPGRLATYRVALTGARIAVRVLSVDPDTVRVTFRVTSTRPPAGWSRGDVADAHANDVAVR